MKSHITIVQEFPFEQCSICNQFQSGTEQRDLYVGDEVCERQIALNCKNATLCKAIASNLVKGGCKEAESSQGIPPGCNDKK